MIKRDPTQALASGSTEGSADIDESFLRAVINTLPDLIWLKDPDGVYLSCNTRFEQLYGVQALSILGKTDYDFVDKKLADYFREHDRKAMLKGAPSVNEEWLTFAADGYRGLFETIKTPMHDRNGRLVGVLGIARDITERSRIDRMLQQREQEFRTLAENAPMNIVRYDLACRAVYANPRMLQTLNLPAEAMLHKRPTEVITGAESEAYEAAIRQVITQQTEQYLEFAWPDAYGELTYQGVRVVPELDSAGVVSGALAMGSDITALKRAELASRQSLDGLRITASVFDTAQEAILITDAHNCIIEVNPAFTTITGYSRDEALGKTPKMLGSGRQSPQFYAEMWQSLQEKKMWRGEIWNRRKCGEVYAELLSISVICDEAGKVQRHVGVFSDITYFKDHEAELSRVANYDALTGIPNRRLLSDRLAQAIAHAQRNGRMLAVCYLDLDGFKEVNDRYGHKTGDDLLVQITRRLQDELRAGDTLARLGGDEFVLLLNDLAQEVECFQILERFMQSISMPVQLEEQWISVSVSIGAVFYLADGESGSGDTLLRHADQAMYVAKQSGKNRIHCHRQH